MKVTCNPDDLNDPHQKHHDGLIVQLTIGNCLTKRVLIDGGSSANVIFLDTLKAMGIDKTEIVLWTQTLVGFNGDSTNTLGEIVLFVFAKIINKQTGFNVIDCKSAYNAILGRPWIHDMNVVPSTYQDYEISNSLGNIRDHKRTKGSTRMLQNHDETSTTGHLATTEPR